MHNRCTQPTARYVITFNGEIYNYRGIRDELAAAGRGMRGDSDTEVLLEACALWGVEGAIERAIGMFAFALWDRTTCTLSLVRDRLGIKPLYYVATPERLLFASQLRAFRAAPDWRPTIDEDAVVGFLRHSYIAQPRTIYREAAKLPPGHFLTLRCGRGPELKCYWDARAVAMGGQQRSNPAPDEDEAIERLDALLRDSVKLRMIADVPLGAFLSGGIDSSTVVALMQSQSMRPVKTFSIGFNATGYNEAHYAKEVASHLRTDHTEFYVEPKHALDLIPAHVRVVRRAFRGQFADSDPFDLRIDAPARNRGAVGRRRRRVVCRLQSLSVGRAIPARRSCRATVASIGRWQRSCARCRPTLGRPCSSGCHFCRKRHWPAISCKKLQRCSMIPVPMRSTEVW